MFERELEFLPLYWGGHSVTFLILLFGVLLHRECRQPVFFLPGNICEINEAHFALWWWGPFGDAKVGSLQVLVYGSLLWVVDLQDPARLELKVVWYGLA